MQQQTSGFFLGQQIDHFFYSLDLSLLAIVDGHRAVLKLEDAGSCTILLSCGWRLMCRLLIRRVLRQRCRDAEQTTTLFNDFGGLVR